MLQLKNITKHYAAGDNTVRALRGINLQFRQHEFVSILGSRIVAMSFCEPRSCLTGLSS